MLAPGSSLTYHNTDSHYDGVSSLVAKECSGSGVVGLTPLQVADGVLHSAPTGGGADY